MDDEEKGSGSMRSHGPYRIGSFLLELATIAVAIVFMVPFYYLFVNSFKSFADILTNTSGLPRVWIGDNYVEAWRIMEYPKALMNSVLFTVVGDIGIIMLASMAAYRIVRHPSRFNQVVFLVFVASMIVPFQSIMIPLMKVLGTLDLLNGRFGLWVSYFGLGVSMAVFLFHGFIKTVPRELEESAVIDGCTSYGVFFRIVFPLLKPIVATVAILNALWIWNDFLLPFLLVNSNQDLRTIPLSTFSFFGQYTKKWDLAMAGLVLSITPIILFFFAMQKQIAGGITAGAIKG